MSWPYEASGIPRGYLLAKLAGAGRDEGNEELGCFPGPSLRGQLGQTMVEYMLVTLMVVSAIMLVMGRLKSQDFFFKNFISPIVQHLKYNYKYADSSALGWDEMASGGPRRHIQISSPNDGQTFRMFLPKKTGP